MSRPFRGKNKDLVQLQVVTADKVWTKNKASKPTLRRDMEIYGRVDKGTSAFVTSTNLSGGNHRIVDDTAHLPKRVKNDVVKILKNENRKVAYLVRTDKKQ
jgi:hypothetical protein